MDGTKFVGRLELGEDKHRTTLRKPGVSFGLTAFDQCDDGDVFEQNVCKIEEPN